MDYCSNCDLGIRVCEYDPNIHNSLIDAISSLSMLPVSSYEEFHPINDSYTSFQYPVINAQQLHPGRMYAWQLKRTYESTLGAQEMFSSIYVFKIFDGYNQTSDNMDLIKLLIGEVKYNELFSSQGLLSGYNQFEGTVLLNGAESSMSELNEIITLIQNGVINIQEISVE